MKIKTVDESTLTLDPDNARLHPKANLDAIQASLERFGQVVPIVVREGVVVGGNGTLTAIRALGWSDVKVVEFEGTPEAARALAVALNRSAELAVWDKEALARTVAELSDDFDSAVMGFTTKELKALLPELVPPEVVVATGLGEDELPSNTRPKPPPALQYALIFDTPEQQQRFHEFLVRLKGLYPEAKTEAERLDALAVEVFGGGE